MSAVKGVNYEGMNFEITCGWVSNENMVNNGWVITINSN